MSYQVIIPYAPFPESPAFARVRGFDWVEAIAQCRTSVRASCGQAVPVRLVTNMDGPSEGDTLVYQTTATRLQLWLTEIRLAFLQSDAFDRDTVLISPDTLVMNNLAGGFRPGADLGIIVRPAYDVGDQEWRKILNTAQWWRVRARAALIAFYQDVWAIAQTLHANYQKWGGDTESLLRRLTPIEAGLVERAGLRVAMIHAPEVFASITGGQIEILEAGGRITWPVAPPMLWDFKYLKKSAMGLAFRAQLGAHV